MIQCTKGKLIQGVQAYKASKGFPSGIMKVARRKLTMLDAASSLDDLRVPTPTGLKCCKATGKGNIQSA
ncbi:hypothetical protein [Meridianimarinicoccus marinus]